MPNRIIVGGQWGDEGKGKIIDVLTEEADVVVRYQGGNNAGHTVKVGESQYILHLIPSGILHPDKTCVIGNGVVVDPAALWTEIEDLAGKGISVEGRLHVSDRAHVILPYHKALDEARETRAAHGRKIGTTKRGIGPCYADKANRVGLRMGDLLEPDLPALVSAHVEEANVHLAALGGRPMDPAATTAECVAVAAKVKRFVTDTVPLLHKALQEGRSILFEGAQGTMLDIDFGSYPFVTSSNTTAGGACTGFGVPPHQIDEVIGVVKAYTTRVGEGPFPTELTDDVGKLMGREGKEFGATTGRPRRCGWFDAVVARYAARINGVHAWAITKLDVLDTLETLKICVAYECDGARYDTVPASARVLARCRPVYEEMKGWRTPTRDAKTWRDLPAAARAYVDRLCELTGAKAGILSVGPQRASTIRIPA